MNFIALSALGSSMNSFSLYKKKVLVLVARFRSFKMEPQNMCN